MTTHRVGLFAVLLLLATSALSVASPITFHNTGEGLIQGMFDPNWTVVLPDGTSFGQAISATDPNGAWIAPTPPNTWISVAGRDAVPLGVYKYSTTFTIGPGADLSTAELSGFWWSDDPAASNGIYLNGANVSNFGGAFWFDPNPANAAFSVTSGFVAGLNVLTFHVTNTGGPGGMLVEGLSGSVATDGVVPEPASLLLVGTGLVGLRAWRKRRD